MISCVEAAFESSGEAETVEFVCYPGYYDPELQGKSTLIETRLQELAALCDPQLSSRLGARGIALANWTILAASGVDDVSRPGAGRDSIWETRTAGDS
jgi:predicted glycoside hydrolase/deacetylase ChbG (UPF0249 family)